MKSAMRAVKNMSYTDIENKVREATNNDPWGVSTSAMAEIARATNHREEYPELFEMVWKRLSDHQHVMHVQKALILIDYLLRNGAERFINDCKRRNKDIAQLTKYKHYDANNRDDAGDCRIKAKAVLELLNNEQKLEEERKKARAIRDVRLSGMGSDAFGSGLGGLGRSATSFGDDDDYPSRDRDEGTNNYSSSSTTTMKKSSSATNAKENGNEQDAPKPKKKSSEATAQDGEEPAKKPKKKKKKPAAATTEGEVSPPSNPGTPAFGAATSPDPFASTTSTNNSDPFASSSSSSVAAAAPKLPETGEKKSRKKKAAATTAPAATKQQQAPSGNYDLSSLMAGTATIDISTGVLGDIDILTGTSGSGHLDDMFVPSVTDEVPDDDFGAENHSIYSEPALLDTKLVVEELTKPEEAPKKSDAWDLASDFTNIDNINANVVKKKPLAASNEVTLSQLKSKNAGSLKSSFSNLSIGSSPPTSSAPPFFNVTAAGASNNSLGGFGAPIAGMGMPMGGMGAVPNFGMNFGAPAAAPAPSSGMTFDLPFAATPGSRPNYSSGRPVVFDVPSANKQQQQAVADNKPKGPNWNRH